MKFIFSYLFIVVYLTACKEKISPYAKTETFKVWGNCGMCETTIEGSLDGEGIYKAEWNQESKMIVVAYDTTKYSLPEIHKKIAASGYDTEMEKGNDESYKELPECCKYERKSDQKL